jgi:cytochrome c-type biogenesis protein CcmH
VSSVLSTDSLNALERELRCQCGCTLDVYTCRTTDPVCQVAPAMHRDVVILAQGGHTADEIREAFADVYGESVLLAPPARGLNLLAYTAPWIVALAAAVVLTVALRRRKGPVG